MESAAEPSSTPTAAMETPPPEAEAPSRAAQIKIRYSHYWPPLGGTNCSKFAGGQCVSATASGQPWEEWVGRGIACPREWPFYTRLVVDGRTWVCVDRGGAIKYVDGVPWVDFLVPEGRYPHGQVVEATLFLR